MPMQTTLPLWTFSLEIQLFTVVLVSFIKISFIVSEYERLPKMTWLDFISGFGGLCGLCLGISFVSLVEILYWFSFGLCKKNWSFRSIVKCSISFLWFLIQLFSAPSEHWYISVPINVSLSKRLFAHFYFVMLLWKTLFNVQYELKIFEHSKDIQSC